MGNKKQTDLVVDEDELFEKELSAEYKADKKKLKSRLSFAKKVWPVPPWNGCPVCGKSNLLEKETRKNRGPKDGGYCKKCLKLFEETCNNKVYTCITCRMKVSKKDIEIWYPDISLRKSYPSCIKCTNEIKHFNSKGFTIEEVKCVQCRRMFKTYVSNIDKKRALMHDIFLCSSKCSKQFSIR